MRSLLRKLFYFFLFIFITGKSDAQEMWGISNSNFAGAMGMELNPATMVGAQYRWEVHLFSADAFMMNNYMYLRKNSGAIKKSFGGEAVAQERDRKSVV